MEIKMDAIRLVEDPHTAFVNSIKNSETLRKYNHRLYNFLQLVPNSIYQEHLGEPLQNDSKETLAKFFVYATHRTSHRRISLWARRMSLW